MSQLEDQQRAYQERLMNSWRAAIRGTFGEQPPKSRTWADGYDVVDVLKGFMDANYSFLPPNGHLPLMGVRHGNVDGQLLFDLSETGECEAYPARVHFEYIENSPENSFFLIDLRTVSPTGIYESVGETEQVLRVEGEYENYGLLDQGIWRYDENGDEIYLPEDTKTVLRLLSGKLLIVCKAGLWNHDSSTWDGRHNHMSATDIRAAIERTIAAGSTKILA